MNFIQFLNESKNKEFCNNLTDITIDNSKFRNILYTGTIQLVSMSLKPQEEIGLESHDTDQFFFFYGDGLVVIKNKEYSVNSGTGFVVPANTKHNIINNTKNELKLFSIYGEPQH